MLLCLIRSEYVKYLTMRIRETALEKLQLIMLVVVFVGDVSCCPMHKRQASGKQVEVALRDRPTSASQV